jgi:hypothetical protein
VHSEALALTNLVWGTSHVVHFGDGLQAASGLNPVPGYSGVSWVPSAGLGGEDIGYIQLAGSASSPSLEYDAQLNDEWTILWHERDGGDWVGAGLTDSGTGYLNGVSNLFVGGASTDVQLSVAGGVAEFGNANASAIDVDQIVILPWRATAAQLAVWTAAQDVLWGPGPALLMSGDMFTEDCVYGYGRVTEVKRVQFSGLNNGAEVSFEIDEIDPTYLRGVFPDCLPATPVVPLTGAIAEAYVFESSAVTLGDVSERGASAPTSPTTITGMPTTEWGLVCGRSPSGDVLWANTIEGVGGSNRAFVIDTAAQPGGGYVVASGWAIASTVEIRDSGGSLLSTLTRPAEITGSLTSVSWGFVVSFDGTTGAVNWTQLFGFDDTANSNSTVCRPGCLSFGGPSGDQLALVTWTRTTRNASLAVPNPTYGTSTVVTQNPINAAGIGAGLLSTQWVILIDPLTGEPISSSSHVANYNDDAPTSGTFTRSSVGQANQNRSNVVWSDASQLWYLSANASARGDFGITGIYIGKGKTGEFQTRNFDEFSGAGSVKAYVCTYNSNLEPVNAVTLAANPVSAANSRFSYNQRVSIVPDGSGDILWGIQNMSPLTAGLNLERNGTDGNYGGGTYALSNSDPNDSLIFRMSSTLDVVWEATAFGSPFAGLGLGHSIDMTPVPNDSSKMLSLISTWSNAPFTDTVSLFGGPNLTFGDKMSGVAGFNLSTGAFVDQRELRRAANGDIMRALVLKTAESGPDQGITFALVHMSNDLNTTNQGFYDTAGARQYTTSDFWNSNGAVYSQINSGAIHLLAYDANGELLPSRCCPLIAIQTGSVALNQWAASISLL